MQRLSPDNFGTSENILTKLSQATWWTLVHILTHPKCVVHCNLTQVHTPRVSFRSLSNHVEAYWCAVMRRFNSVFFWAARVNVAASLVAAPANRRLVLFGLIRPLSLLREEFRLSKFTLNSDLRRRAASRLVLPCTSSYKILYID